MEKPLLFESANGIAVITLNRPEKRNCFNQQLLAMLFDAIEEVSRNDAITVAIITGNGKSFCTGIDLSVLGKEDLFDPRGDGKEYPDVIGACHKPVIGAINGHAITGGFEIALNCDFLIASENAVFGDTHAKVGIHPGWGMTQLLQQAVGRRMAKQMSLTCQYINAEQALHCGLVNEVVPAEKLMPRVMEIASQICAVNREMMMTVKGVIEYRNHATLEQAYANERSEFKKWVEKMSEMMKPK